MVEGRRHRVLPMEVMLMVIGANEVAGFFEQQRHLPSDGRVSRATFVLHG